MKLAVVTIPGAAAALPARARSTTGLTVSGTLTGISSMPPSSTGIPLAG